MIKILSMNIRGLGADPKFLALKNLFNSSSSKIILIQEIMHGGPETIAYFRHMFPSWHISATGAIGLSGGLAMLWDPVRVLAKTFRCIDGILLAKFKGMAGPVHILNVYAPYKDRLSFWKRFLPCEIMGIDSLLIAGDLNCTLSSMKCGEEEGILILWEVSSGRLSSSITSWIFVHQIWLLLGIMGDPKMHILLKDLIVS